MAHWTDYSLRGWLSFLAFMHAGMALRSYLDVNFVYGKVYAFAEPHGHASYELRGSRFGIVDRAWWGNIVALSSSPLEPWFARLFGLYSLGQSFVLLQAAIHLYVRP